MEELESVEALIKRLSTTQIKEIVHAYLEQEGLGTYKIEEYLQRFWLHVASCMHVPRGLADGAGTGSQQAAFTFHVPSSDQAVVDKLVMGLILHKGLKYSLDEQARAHLSNPNRRTRGG